MVSVETIKQATSDLKNNNLFAACFVKRSSNDYEATYAVYYEDYDAHAIPLFYRSIRFNVKACEELKSEAQSEAIKALFNAFYTVESIKCEAIEQALENVIFDQHDLPESDTFGRMVFCSTLDEIHLSEENKVIILHSDSVQIKDLVRH